MVSHFHAEGPSDTPNNVVPSLPGGIRNEMDKCSKQHHGTFYCNPIQRFGPGHYNRRMTQLHGDQKLDSILVNLDLALLGVNQQGDDKSLMDTYTHPSTDLHRSHYSTKSCDIQYGILAFLDLHEVIRYARF